MKIANIGGHVTKTERGVSIEITPDSNGPKIKTLRVALSREVGDAVPTNGTVTRIKNRNNPDRPGILMIFPEKKPDDNRYLVIEGWGRPAHRCAAGIDEKLTTGEILETSYGYGAWGSGVAFIAILSPGQRIVSYRSNGGRKVIFIENDQIKSVRMTDEEWTQFQLDTTTTPIFEVTEL